MYSPHYVIVSYFPSKHREYTFNFVNSEASTVQKKAPQKTLDNYWRQNIPERDDPNDRATALL